MANEKIERNKWIDAVAKLVSLTQERKLVWRVTYGQAQGWDPPPTLYEATYGNKTLRLSPYPRLSLVEPGSDAAWEFPETEATSHLLEAVEYQVLDVGNFIDDLLTEAV